MKNIKEIEIEVSGKEWETALDGAFKAKKKDLKVDGFRKGACPKDVYIKKFGLESLFMDAVDTAANTAFQKILKEQKLVPVCEPKIDVTHICDTCVNFKFTIIEKPSVKLGKYKGLGIKRDEPKVTADEIATEISKLQDKYADVTEDNDGEVAEGSTAVIDFKGEVDGQLLEGGSGENYPLEIGSHTFIPGFEEGLVGMKVDEEKVLNLKFPEDYVDNLKNKEVVFTVKVTGIKKRVLPELNEDFYKDLGYENIKSQNELESEISKKLLDQKLAETENKYIDELLKKATDNLEVEVNQEIIDSEIERMIDQYRQQLQMQGLSLEQYLEFTKSNLESLQKMMEPESIMRIKSRYLLEEVAEKEKIDITDAEVTEEIKRLAETYGAPEEDIVKMVGNEEIIKYDLKMRAAIDILKNN